MKKLVMQTPDLTEKNVEKIKEFFPNVVTEKEGKNGVVEKAVDFDLLRQMLSKDLVGDDNERYRLDWPGKKASLLKANTPLNSTLRPDRDSSVNFDTTENVFIEGDNFEVLKVLQESYLGKIKMCYIDPPYNTGTAMIYSNDFSKTEGEYEEYMGAVDDEGIKMFKNTDSNGRFHSDWLSMMYERIIVARDLLKDDGFMALAIDHNELHNLTSICDEIFGEQNKLGVVTVVHKPEGRNQEKFFGTSNEFMLVYSKNRDVANFCSVVLDEEIQKTFNLSDDDGKYRLNNYLRVGGGDDNLKINKPHFFYPVYVKEDLSEITLEKKKGYYEILPITNAGQERTWKTNKETFLDRVAEGKILAVLDDSKKINIYEKYREDQVIKTHWIDKKYNAINQGTKVIDDLLKAKIFDFPKALPLIVDILKLTSLDNDIVLDFFAGSGTTAHAVMQLNTEDGGNRKFVMVQIPEKTENDSGAFKAGYKTISEISMERIRRAGKKIVEENKDKLVKREKPLDIGFRAVSYTHLTLPTIYSV